MAFARVCGHLFVCSARAHLIFVSVTPRFAVRKSLSDQSSSESAARWRTEEVGCHAWIFSSAPGRRLPAWDLRNMRNHTDGPKEKSGSGTFWNSAFVDLRQKPFQCSSAVPLTGLKWLDLLWRSTVDSSGRSRSSSDGMSRISRRARWRG